MSTLVCLRRRVLFLRLVVALALAVPLLRPVARAVSVPPPVDAGSGPTAEADQTWGVWPTPDGRAPRVRALAVVGRTVFLGGDFTTMAPPGSALPKPPPRTIAEFPLKVLLAIVTVALPWPTQLVAMPPPYQAELPLIVQLLTVKVP